MKIKVKGIGLFEMIPENESDKAIMSNIRGKYLAVLTPPLSVTIESGERLDLSLTDLDTIKAVDMASGTLTTRNHD